MIISKPTLLLRFHFRKVLKIILKPSITMMRRLATTAQPEIILPIPILKRVQKVVVKSGKMAITIAMITVRSTPVANSTLVIHKIVPSAM